jgi:hypothetical protein
MFHGSNFSHGRRTRAFQTRVIHCYVKVNSIAELVAIFSLE